MGDDWDGEGAEELAGGVLQEADADALAEAFETGAVGGVGVGSDGDGGDAEDGAEVGGIGEVVEGEIALLLPGHGDDDVAGEEALVGIDEFGAGLGHFVVAAGVDVDDLHGAEDAAGTGAAAGGFEGGFGDGDDVLLLGLGGVGRVGKFGREWRCGRVSRGDSGSC